MNKIIGTFSFCSEASLLVYQLETMMLFCDEVLMLADNPTEDALSVARAYVDKKNIFLHTKIKQDNFNERDEWGDRQLLLQGVRERNGTIHFHTDADEIVLLKDIDKLVNVLHSVKQDEIHYLNLNTFWGNTHNYRIPYTTKENAGKIIPGIKSGSVMPYIYSIKNALNYPQKTIPNFHAPRVPQFSVKMKEIYHDITMLHYGYYSDNIINQKQQFYNTNKNKTGNVWGEDMQVNTCEYIEKWGMGLQERKYNR